MKDKNLNHRLNVCFKKYDIRCIYGEELSEELLYNIGRAIVSFLKCKEFIVARDVRSSSDSLEKAFVRGITEGGANAIDIGMVDTPALYFASGFWKMPGAIITASHNAGKYNGLKIVRSGAVPIGDGTGLMKIKDLVEKDNFPKRKKGKIVRKSIIKDYIKHIHSFVDLKKMNDLKLVIDSGNGMAGKMIPLVYGKFRIKVHPLDFKIFGHFPKHAPNPIKKENIRDLMKLVKKKKFDGGVAFDSDMDRAVFVDELGRKVDPSLIGALIIKRFFDKNPRVVYGLTSSRVVPELVQKLRGKSGKERVGHSFIKARMKKMNANFGCENSAHYYYRKNYYADSGLITSLMVCQILHEAKKENKTFSQILKEFEIYSKSDEKNVKVRNKITTLKKLETKYKKKALKMNKLDGLTFEFKDYWFNVRPSNTESVLRINLEAQNKKIMNEKLKEVLRVVSD